VKIQLRIQEQLRLMCQFNSMACIKISLMIYYFWHAHTLLE